ncbi:MAG: PAS domain S-box protein [Desulfobacteraceae bacterium]|nr:PAS domain S-box protein [Desulfobacteraceae bacterium]
MKQVFPEDTPETDTLSFWRTRILSTMLFFGIAVGLFVLISILPMAIEKRLWGLVCLDALIWSAAVCLLLLPQIPYRVRAAFALLFAYIIGLAIIVSVGPLSGGPAWLFCFAVLAGVLLGPRAAVIALVVNTLTLGAIGYLMIQGVFGADFPFFDSQRLMVVAGINFLFLNALSAISVAVLVRGLTASHEKEKQLAVSLKKEQTKLEAEIRDKNKAEASLSKSEEKYRNILESIEDGYYEVDLRGNYTFFNESMCRILGYSQQELMGLNNRDYMDKDNAKKIYTTFSQVFQTGVPTKALDWQLIRKDGTACFVETVVSLIKDDSGRGVGFRGIARDVSDRRHLEKQLLQAHKMESIGTLAGGIAHDFNNLLYIMMGNTELAMDEIRDGNPLSVYLERIKSACLRAADVVKQLLNFSKETAQDLKPLDIVAAIREETRFLRTIIPSTIDIRPHLPTEGIFIAADPAQINQALMNICTNAAQAMEKTGGSIDITAGRMDLAQDQALQYPNLLPGPYTRILIEDTGPGIDPENLDRIFDPYFTTREVGKGSGMGLAVVHGIVTHHKGAVGVRSEKGKGAAFTLLFPVIGPAPETSGPKKEGLE